ncbi:hypothetical protein N8K70_04015 [Microbacterium betulae]|uniref:Uncharacterized protein n=1 Tax=Microbacterium betulae TaxID=2981139 RepID=A0AA97FLY0_9MICO|nr:hypothetical protein [Microbacterium sp. AB]WOF23857.1 hypothetical protein N8K70_04015 [Microbacterium sp. AB]
MLDPSDIVLLVAAGIVLVFWLDYGLLSPWYRSPLGWVIFLYGGAMVALLSLVVYAIVFDQRAEEWYRLPIALAVAGSATAKITILHYERHRGRQAHTKKDS